MGCGGGNYQFFSIYLVYVCGERSNGGFDRGGYSSANILQSDGGVFLLGKPADGQWTVAELDPIT